jgi:hypothetical protein
VDGGGAGAAAADDARHHADARARALRIERPVLPEWPGRIRLDDLRVGDASVTLAFERDGSVTGFALLGQRGKLSVMMSADG